MNDNRRNRTSDGDGSELPARMTYGDKERAAVHAEKRRIYMRTAHCDKDWDGKADNDNLNWPLATALIREGNTELLKAAVAYRRIYDDANSGAVLGGKTYTAKDGKVIERISRLDESTGKIEYGKARQSKSADAVASTPARRKNVTNEATISATSPIGRPWSGDRAVNDMIDGKAKLESLRVRLGVLVEPLELAIIDGATYRVVGNAAGISNKAGSEGAGRALTHTALIAVRDALGHIKREDLAA